MNVPKGINELIEVCHDSTWHVKVLLCNCECPLVLWFIGWKIGLEGSQVP